MAIRQRVMTKYDQTEYGEITDVQATPEGQLTVTFRDGDTIHVDGRHLVRPAATDLRWTEARIGQEFSDWVEIPDANGEVEEIPWDVLRRETDPEFLALWRIRSGEIDAVVGRRLRELRELRGISQAELARRAGISSQSLSRIEHGKHGLRYRTVDQLLTALGCTLRDIVVDEPEHVPAG